MPALYGYSTAFHLFHFQKVEQDLVFYKYLLGKYLDIKAISNTLSKLKKYDFLKYWLPTCSIRSIYKMEHAIKMVLIQTKTSVWISPDRC